MPQAEVLRKLEFNGQTHLVEDLSPEVQQLVAVYNEWNQDAVDARKTATQLQASVQAVHTQIGEQLQKEAAAEAERVRIASETATSDAVADGLIDPADGEPLIDTE